MTIRTILTTSFVISFMTVVSACILSEEIATPKVQSETVDAQADSSDSDVQSDVAVLPPPVNTWQSIASMNEARLEHTMTTLADGRVLITGGIGEGAIDNALDSTEMWDPTAQSFMPAAPMKFRRARHTATLLSDGRVLVTGGYDGKSHIGIASAELYDPAANSWTTNTFVMTEPRMYHDAAVLPNGKVLIASGCCDTAYPTAEVYDPASGTFTATPALGIAHAAPTLTMLPNGLALLIGNSNDPYAELYAYQIGSWSAAASLQVARTAHTATWVPSENAVVVAGGASKGALTASVESYDPFGNGWTLRTPLAMARRNHTATRISIAGSDDVVWVGGADASGNAMATCERFSGNPCPSLETPRHLHRALVVSVGGQYRIMVTGGLDATNQPTKSAEVLFF